MPEWHLKKRGQSMAYKLNVTEYADGLLERVNVVGIFHQLENYKNKL